MGRVATQADREGLDVQDFVLPVAELDAGRWGNAARQLCRAVLAFMVSRSAPAAVDMDGTSQREQPDVHRQLNGLLKAAQTLARLADEADEDRVQFIGQPHYRSDLDALVLIAQLDGRRYRCVVTLESLADLDYRRGTGSRPDPSEAALLDALGRHQPEVHLGCARRVRAGAVDAKGDIIFSPE